MTNQLRNAKVVGDGIANESYLGQVQGVNRGHPEFVISRSELMLFASCPARWLSGYSFKDTDATWFGSLVDCLLTTPKQFTNRYVETPKTVIATKTMACVKDGDAEAGDPVPWQTCKEATDWKKQQKKNGIEPVSADDMADAQAAVKRFKEDMDIAALLACSKKQVMCVAEYHDEETGLVIPTKCLIDLVPQGEHVIGLDWAKKDLLAKNVLADIKTIRNAAMRPWLRTIDENNYDAQAAIGLDHYNAATDENRAEFLFPLMENVFPFQPARRYLSPQFLKFGRTKYLHALRWYCQCLKAGKWPGYEEGWSLCEPDSWHSTLKH